MSDDITEIDGVEDPKISHYFSGRRRVNSRNAIAYRRAGDFVVVEVISSGLRQDARNFEIGKDDENFCKFAFDKLGIDFKRYQRYKKRQDSIQWQ